MREALTVIALFYFGIVAWTSLWQLRTNRQTVAALERIGDMIEMDVRLNQMQRRSSCD